MKLRQVIGPGGDIYYYSNGRLHRENGPAVEYPDGTKVWYLNGKRHREDGPAIEHLDGTKIWCLNGEILTEEELLSEKIKINYLKLYNSYLVHQIMEE